eukprot:6417290-Amphidinium_carterae.1
MNTTFMKTTRLTAAFRQQCSEPFVQSMSLSALQSEFGAACNAQLSACRAPPLLQPQSAFTLRFNTTPPQLSPVQATKPLNTLAAIPVAKMSPGSAARASLFPSFGVV